MARYFLITTALEKTWRDDEPVLFLGEWCQRYSRKDLWSKIDAKVLPYHWDDRTKLHADYQYLKKFYEQLLLELTVQLNQIHSVDHSQRYWRILIGPWLGLFTQTLFDRWASLKQATDKYEFSGTYTLIGQEETLVPNDMGDLVHFQVGDEWNHHIYSTILSQFTAVPCIKRARIERVPKTASPITLKTRVKRELAKRYSQSLSVLTQDQDAFLLNTYLPVIDEMRINWRLSKVPQLWRSVPPVKVAMDKNWRQWVVSKINPSGFEKCARTLIPQQIPKIYLEGYNQLVSQAMNLPWPKRPKTIWTSSSQWGDDVFKAWAAEKVDQGVPMVIGQHGGLYGVNRWSFLEDHEMEIGDYYLSWGWAKPGQPKIKPVGMISAKQPLGVYHLDQPYALLVIGTVPRQSSYLFSGSISSQRLDYFDAQYAFVKSLPAAIRDVLIVRLAAMDYGWDQAARWHDRFPDVRMDKGISNISNLIRKSRLSISTYNSTTYLESFAMDVPTVIYWNSSHWELRDSAITHFEDLKNVGIFHETPESAARQVAAIWDNVDTWWNSPAVREVLKNFKARYCHLSDDLLGDVEDILRDIKTVPK